MFILSNKLHRAGWENGTAAAKKEGEKCFRKLDFLQLLKLVWTFLSRPPEVGGFSPTSVIQTWYLSEKKASVFFILRCQTSCLACRQPTCDWFLWFLYFVLNLFIYFFALSSRFVTSRLAHQSFSRRGKKKRKTWLSLVLLQNGSSEKREVRQFQFTAWPDHGVPEYPTPFLAFLRRVKTCNPPDAGPIIAHCRSAATFKWFSSSLLIIGFLFRSCFHKDSKRQRYLE